jgi:hypothetical protein
MPEGETRRLLSRALHETLEAYVTPAVRQQLLRHALDLSGLSAPPSTPDETDRFLHDGLFEAATQLLGRDIAESIIDEIWGLVLSSSPPPSPRRDSSRATSTVPASGRRMTPRDLQRRPSRPNVSTAPAQRRSLSPRSVHPPRSEIRWNTRAVSTGPAVTPGEYFRKVTNEDAASQADRGPVRVLAATADHALLAALAHALGKNGEVYSLRSVFSLLHAVQERDQHRLFILLDCESPGIRPAALAALAEDLADVTVVLCRASMEIEYELALISPATRDWVRLSDHESPLDVALGCAELVS